MNTLQKLASAIRFLSIDAVEKAKSGHPGMPLGMADIAAVLWQKYLIHNPGNPNWFNRDRFVLSNGHGSMLLYSLLHLSGYDLTIEDLKSFRQLNSKTPGHPENIETPGVETTTGPLGQGIANGVGMAIAQKILASNFNTPDFNLIDHYTYVFLGDGCLMEGISHEACSLAGTLGLNKLILFYDDNGISIDGKVEHWFTEDAKMRFEAYNFNVIGPIDGHNLQEIDKAIEMARTEQHRPSIIICKTIIGYGSKSQDSAKVHGAPLGTEDITSIREHFNWHHAAFEIPKDIYNVVDHKEKGHADEAKWQKMLLDYTKAHPKKAQELIRRINQELPSNWQEETEKLLHLCSNNTASLPTRKASQNIIENLTALLPELIGGSADLTSSNNTDCSLSKAITNKDFNGNYIYYGVREFAMSAIMNGIAVHGGFIPYGGTFLVFSDYARNAIRLSALMKKRVIYIFTHDSIGLGEDGPTHQPIEHIQILRMTPGLNVWRPCNLLETAVAWQNAIETANAPSALLLSRQSIPYIEVKESDIANVKRGGYILRDCKDTPDIILIATGSEVPLALQAKEEISDLNIRVVSMPSVEIFLEQPLDYQEYVLPKKIRKRIVIEASASAFWYKFTGLDGHVIGIDRFGVSAPAKDAYQEMNLTVENIINSIYNLETQYGVTCCN